MEFFLENLWVISIVVLVVTILWAAFSYIKFYKTEHLVCPKCGHSWKPPVLKMVLAANAVEGKIIRCPNCGAKEYIEPTKD